MNLFDELAKDSEEYLKNYDEGGEGAAGDVMKQIADLEKKMTEKLEEATKNLTKTPDAEGVEGAKIDPSLKNIRNSFSPSSNDFIVFILNL